MLDVIDQQLISLLQGDLPENENPYAAMAARIGITEEETVQRLKDLNAQGKLKRIGAILRHQNAGYTENAMVVFAVPSSRMDAVAGDLAACPLVSHCYERGAHEEWPYTLYAMLHSREKDDIEVFVEAFATVQGISDYAVLYSLEELKKSSMVFF